MHAQCLIRQQCISVLHLIAIQWQHPVVLYRSSLDSQTRAVPSVLCTYSWLSVAFCGEELDCAGLLGDTGEEGCGVSVLSLMTSSASSSLCCTEERYCSSRLHSVLSTSLLPPATQLRTGLNAHTVFRVSTVPLLRKLASCGACRSVDWKPESGKDTSMLGGIDGPEATDRGALHTPGEEVWAGVTAWVMWASCSSTDCFHCCIDWSYMESTGIVLPMIYVNCEWWKSVNKVKNCQV